MNQKEVITSISNNKIKNIISLQTKSKARKEQKKFVIEGIKIYEEALADASIESTYISQSYYNEMKNTDNGRDFLSRIGDYEIVKDNIFKNISDTMTPQGIIGVMNQPEFRIDDITKKERFRVLILEELRDPGNLGTIIRTAEGAGMSGIIMNKNSVDIFNPKVIRSTMGSIFRVPFIIVDDLIPIIDLLKQKGTIVMAAHLDGKPYYDAMKTVENIGLLIGNESKGLSNIIASAADTLIKIPMEGKVESLNAAIAASILMYEMVRY